MWSNSRMELQSNSCIDLSTYFVIKDRLSNIGILIFDISFDPNYKKCEVMIRALLLDDTNNVSASYRNYDVIYGWLHNSDA